jgi:hypothetical protein
VQRDPSAGRGAARRAGPNAHRAEPCVRRTRRPPARPISQRGRRAPSPSIRRSASGSVPSRQPPFGLRLRTRHAHRIVWGSKSLGVRDHDCWAASTKRPRVCGISGLDGRSRGRVRRGRAHRPGGRMRWDSPSKMRGFSPRFGARHEVCPGSLQFYLGVTAVWKKGPITGVPPRPPKDEHAN